MYPYRYPNRTLTGTRSGTLTGTPTGTPNRCATAAVHPFGGSSVLGGGLSSEAEEVPDCSRLNWWVISNHQPLLQQELLQVAPLPARLEERGEDLASGRGKALGPVVEELGHPLLEHLRIFGVLVRRSRRPWP